MKICVGIGQGLTFFAIDNIKRGGQKCFFIREQDNKKIFDWLKKYLVFKGFDISLEHEWYEIDLDD